MVSFLMASVRFTDTIRALVFLAFLVLLVFFLPSLPAANFPRAIYNIASVFPSALDLHYQTLARFLDKPHAGRLPVGPPFRSHAPLLHRAAFGSASSPGSNLATNSHANGLHMHASASASLRGRGILASGLPHGSCYRIYFLGAGQRAEHFPPFLSSLPLLDDGHGIEFGLPLPFGFHSFY